MTRRNAFALAAAGLVLAAAGWVLAGPTALQPQAWDAPADPGLTGPYAANDALAAAERLFVDEIAGADALAAGPGRTLAAALDDGRVVVLDPEARSLETRAVVPGRPLGLVQTGPESFVVASPSRGLVASAKGVNFPVVEELDGEPLRHVSDVALGGGILYFTDASSRLGPGRAYDAILEHRADGRVLRYDELARSLTVLAKDLHFPSALALGPGDAYLLVSETASYRVLRVWLAGPKAGTTEVFIDALPGFPAHITWNGRDRFWLALYAPRIPALDRLAGSPYWRAVLARLPVALQPRPPARAWVLGLDVDGAVVANLQASGRDAFAPVSSAREQDGWLYLGSQTAPGIARVRIPR